MRTLIRGANIYTGGPDPSEAMYIVDGTIRWVGTGEAAMSYVDQSDEMVELGGALVTPAFVDAHVHTTTTGLSLTGLNLTGATSLADMLDTLERHCRRERGHHVLGHGWEESRWPEGRAPTRQELDRASYGGVVYLTRIDVHSAVASSALIAALPELKVLDGYNDSGLLTRAAHHVARAAALSTISPLQREHAHVATFEQAARRGIGCLHELGGPEISGEQDFAAVLSVAKQGKYLDVVGYWGQLGVAGIEVAQRLEARGAAGDLFADGALGSHTACLRDDYLDADHPGERGAAYLSSDQVHHHVVACTRASLQAGFHVIGDGALDTVAEGFRLAAKELGTSTLRAARHRLEHVEMVDTDHIALFAELGIVASVQPAFDALWGGADGMYVQRLGLTRAGAMNPYADMNARGIVLAFGSDAPVTRLDPWAGVRAAVNHQTPRQRLDVHAAFAAHTVGGWYAAGDDDGGVLAAGRDATYAVWDTSDTNRYQSSSGGLPDFMTGDKAPTCRRTVVRGRTIFIEDEVLA